MKKIARVFPRKTKASPDDALAFFGPPPKGGLPEMDEVHVSVAFTYDLPKAEQLAEAWRAVGVPVLLGGPATGQRGEDFTPGLYLKQGYVITSRGCDNACWFCSVPKREGKLRELPITAGFNVLDDNLLACSEEHIRGVFAMLAQQKERPLFTGGLEAKRLKPWHAKLLAEAKTQRMYFAYDTPDDLEPLIAAGKLLAEVNLTGKSRKANCYVLIGYPAIPLKPLKSGCCKRGTRASSPLPCFTEITRVRHSSRGAAFSVNGYARRLWRHASRRRWSHEQA